MTDKRLFLFGMLIGAVMACVAKITHGLLKALLIYVEAF